MMDMSLGDSGLAEPAKRTAVWSRPWAWAWRPAATFVATRLGILLIAYLAVGLLPEPASAPYHLRGTDNVLQDVFGSRWDTGFYVSIAEEGYRFRDATLPSVAFFPLYPLMMRTVAAVVGDAVVAGLIISNVALLLATLLFYRLVADEWGTAVADRTIWYWLIFPTAFFGVAVYTEAVFLLLAIGALYFARRGYWEIAALLGVAAALTRLVGVLVAPLLLVEWWTQRRREGAGASRWGWLAGVATPVGTAAYMAYLWRAFGDPLAFVTGAAAWERQPQSPIITIGELLARPEGGWLQALLAGRIHLDNWLDLGFVLLFVGLGLALLYRRRWSEGVFVLLGVTITFSSGLLMSQRRYVWVFFPAFLVLALWGERPWVDRLVTVLSLLGLGLFVALFANGYWVG